MTHEQFESIAALDAVGAASIEEERDLRAHLETCADCRRVRDEYAEAATMLAQDLEPVAPPAETRGRILDSIDVPVEDNVVEMAPRRSGMWWLTIAATLFLAMWGWRELGIRTWRERLSNQGRELQQLRDQNDLLATKNEKLSAEINALASADTRTIALSGQQMSPSASAKVFLEPGRRRAVVFFYNMPANAKDKSYQLWIIRGDQPKPQSAGTFDAGPTGDAQIVVENLPLATEIKALAVTLEPRGGVEQPTNTNFVVMGNT